MTQTTETLLPITVSQQKNVEKDLIEISLITGQKLYLNPGAARMLACDLIQAAYQAEIHNQRRDPRQAKPSTPLSVVAVA